MHIDIYYDKIKNKNKNKNKIIILCLFILCVVAALHSCPTVVNKEIMIVKCFLHMSV